ncbi:hypothetical protein JOM56_004627 [Amanita muscaria]
MAPEQIGNDALDAPEFWQQNNLNVISEDEYARMLHDLVSQPSMNQSQPPANGSLSLLTDFNAPEGYVKDAQNSNVEDMICSRHGVSSSVNTISGDLFLENGEFSKTPGLYPQFLETPYTNRNIGRTHSPERFNRPHLLSEYPIVPYSDGLDTPLQPHTQDIDPALLLREQIPHTIPHAPGDTGSTVMLGDKIHGLHDRALQSLPDDPSLATSFLSNYEQFRRVNIHNTVDQSQHEPIPACRNPQTAPDDRFINVHGGTVAGYEEPSRDYSPLTRTRGRPRGRPRMRSHVLLPPISQRSHNFQVQCDWEGRCGAYVKADHASVSRHIRLHIANELFKAMTSVDGAISNVRYMFNPSRSGLGSQFQLDEVEPEVRVRMVLESGKVWAKCLWGTNGCCHGRGELTLEYLPRHVCYMHLGLAKH